VPPSRATALEAVVRRDRLVVLAGLIGVSALAWGYTVVLAGHDMESRAGAMAATHHRAWSAADLAMTFLMWVVMMVAMMLPTAAPVVLAAGAFQLTPLKHACLRHCRSPLGFVLAEWRPGARGALRMGLVHGLYCAGCCWALMALMFFAGTMNLLWIAGLALLMFAEKVLPGGRLLGHAVGAALVVWGLHALAADALRWW
jgi:predicted metal-binding membrane protein